MQKRKTIGLIINEIDGNFDSTFWKSMKNAAIKYDCNLIAFEGRELDLWPSIKSKHNYIYSLISQKRLDGIIAASGTLIEALDNRGLYNFLKQFSHIPMVSIGQVIEGVPSLLVDNKMSMKKLVSHFIKDHGYKRVAFIKGRKLNEEANERFNAYVEVLKENNIKIDNNLVFDGDFRSDTAYRIMRENIGKNINFDAVICANDETAIGMIKAAKELNIKIPHDYAICGFDDTVNSSAISPPLTTVSQPLDEMCAKAVELLLKRINHEKIDDTYIFSGTLMVRDSCGCNWSGNRNNLFQGAYFNGVRGYNVHENIQTYSMDELFDQITGALKELDIRSCYIVKYSDGSVYSDKSFILPVNSQMIYAYYDNRQIKTNKDTLYFETKNILPDSVFPHDRRFTYLVNPLFFKNEQFGFVVFEAENDDVFYYELMRGQISNTLKTAMLVMEKKKMEENLSKLEQLASLGHLIEGISHSLTAPIMSVSNISTALTGYVKELTGAIDDFSVTEEDREGIADNMSNRLAELQSHIKYISNIISEARQQAVQLNASTSGEFSIAELLCALNLLLEVNLKFKCFNIAFKTDIDPNITIKGEMSNLVQVLRNLIVNASESYEEYQNRHVIELTISHTESDVLISVKDFGTGIPDNIKSKLFKQTVTTKGNNRTGLSLLLSYSTIIGKFRGKMWLETVPDKGTTFHISIPLK